MGVGVCVRVSPWSIFCPYDSVVYFRLKERRFRQRSSQFRCPCHERSIPLLTQLEARRVLCRMGGECVWWGVWGVASGEEGGVSVW